MDLRVETSEFERKRNKSKIVWIKRRKIWWL